MRKWVLYLDLALLLMCLGLLIVDLQIKNDLVDQMKRMQGVIDGQTGQGSEECDSSDNPVFGSVRTDNGGYRTAVETTTVEDAGTEGTKPRTRNAPRAKRSTGNASSRIQLDGEQVGS